MTTLTDPFPSPVVNPDVQEAESLRYGASAFMVLSLRSGRIAVLGHMRALHAICDTWEEALIAAQSIPMNVWRRSVEVQKTKPSVLVHADIDLFNLDLDL